MIKINLWVSASFEWRQFEFKDMDEMRESKEIKDRKIFFGSYATVGDNAKVGDKQKVEDSFVWNSLCEFNMIGFKGHLNIGCKFHTIKEWERIFRKGVYKSLCKDYKKCEQAFNKVKKILT